MIFSIISIDDILGNTGYGVGYGKNVYKPYTDLSAYKARPYSTK